MRYKEKILQKIFDKIKECEEKPHARALTVDTIDVVALKELWNNVIKIKP